MLFVKVCLLVAQTSATPQIVDTGDVRFFTKAAQDVYRCKYVREREVNNYLRSKGITRYRLKVESKGYVIK